MPGCNVGRAVLSGTQILDGDANDCPTGTPGTAWFAGTTASEYVGDPDQTSSKRPVVDRTSTVGEVGYLDEDGYLFLADRKALLIRCGGVNIDAQESASLLVTHPKVVDAAVTGMPNHDFGEEVDSVQPVDVIIMGDDALEQELIGICRQHMAHRRCPRGIDFNDALHRLPAGKLYKGVSRDSDRTDRDTRIA